MTASKTNETSGDKSDGQDSSTDDYTYHAEGSGHARGELFDAALRDHPTQIHFLPVQEQYDYIHLAIVVGGKQDQEWSFDTDIKLDPEQAEELARDLLQFAAEGQTDAD